MSAFPVPTIRLTGAATQGIVVSGEHRLALAAADLPVDVRLGRRPPRPELKHLLVHLADHFDAWANPTPPRPTNWRTKAAPALARMYLNDRYGCCVVAGKAHALGVWSANDADAGGIVQATDAEVLDQYHSVCGPGDKGCVITDVLDHMVRSGLTAGGRSYRLDGYAAVDWTNRILVQTVCALGGASTIGINLPEAWTHSDVWDVTSSRIVGGHDVTPIDFDERGVYVSSWGRVYLITWAAFCSSRWLEEMYFLLSPLWYGADRLAPNGINAVTLAADLVTFREGRVPSVDGPAPDPGPTPGPTPIPSPTPAPVPIAPPTVLYNLDFRAMGGRRRGQEWRSVARADIPAAVCSLVCPALPAPAATEAGVEDCPTVDYPSGYGQAPSGDSWLTVVKAIARVIVEVLP